MILIDWRNITAVEAMDDLGNLREQLVLPHSAENPTPAVFLFLESSYTRYANYCVLRGEDEFWTPSGQLGSVFGVLTENRYAVGAWMKSLRDRYGQVCPVIPDYDQDICREFGVLNERTGRPRLTWSAVDLISGEEIGRGRFGPFDGGFIHVEWSEIRNAIGEYRHLKSEERQAAEDARWAASS